MKRGYTCNRTLVKVYVCVFVCMVTKAVDLEMVTDLTSEAFLAALCRFIGRRGCPETLAMDNGSNFVGAQKELREDRQIYSVQLTISSGHILQQDRLTLVDCGRQPLKV